MTPTRWFTATLILLSITPAARAQTMILDLEDSGWDDVRAVAASIAADGYGLGHNSTEAPDRRTFEVDFVPASDDAKLAAFSDDGVTVYVTDLATGTETPSNVARLGQGQALPNIDQSLHTIDYTFTAGHAYRLRIEYDNTLYTGQADIDGCVLLAYDGGGASVDEDDVSLNLTLPDVADEEELDPGYGLPHTIADLASPLPSDAAAIPLQVDVDTPAEGEITFAVSNPHVGLYRKNGSGELELVQAAVSVSADGLDEEFYLHGETDFVGEGVVDAEFRVGPTDGMTARDAVRVYSSDAVFVDIDLDTNQDGTVDAKDDPNEDVQPGAEIPRQRHRGPDHRPRPGRHTKRR